MMKVVAMRPGEGKTADAVRIANETGAYLVVKNRAEVVRVSKLFKCDRFPLTYDELLETKLKGSWVKNVVIDNVEMFLQYVLSGIQIDAVTLTVVDPPHYDTKDRRYTWCTPQVYMVP